MKYAYSIIKEHICLAKQQNVKQEKIPIPFICSFERSALRLPISPLLSSELFVSNQCYICLYCLMLEMHIILQNTFVKHK